MYSSLLKVFPPTHDRSSYLIISLLQPSHRIASHCGVGEMGGQQLQGVLHIHGLPLSQQLQSLLCLLGQIPVHTFEELCQGLQSKEEESMNMYTDVAAAVTGGGIV